MLLTVTEAAEAAGVSRSTLYRAIEAGELTRTPDKRVDVAELVRVYGELRTPVEAAAATSGTEAPARPAGESGEPASHAAWLQDLVETQNATIARLHAQLEAAAADLREADVRAERREETWMRQLDRMTALLPAPAEPPVEPEPPPRGFWSRLIG